MHAKGHDGAYKSASNQVDHHLSASGDNDASADRYHAVLSCGSSGTIPIHIETIPLDKATATAVRWSDVTDPESVKADISRVDIKKEDGSTQTIATFPVDSAMGRLYKLNANNKSFSKGVKLTEFPTDTGSHMAVSDASHAEERAASLAEALSDTGAFNSLDIHLHAPGYERPGPVNVKLQFRRNNGDPIEPIGTQVQDADGKLTDKGNIKLPEGIHLVLSLVDGPATGVEASETPGADEVVGVRGVYATVFLAAGHLGPRWRGICFCAARLVSGGSDDWAWRDDVAPCGAAHARPPGSSTLLSTTLCGRGCWCGRRGDGVPAGGVKATERLDKAVRGPRPRRRGGGLCDARFRGTADKARPPHTPQWVFSGVRPGGSGDSGDSGDSEDSGTLGLWELWGLWGLWGL